METETERIEREREREKSKKERERENKRWRETDNEKQRQRYRDRHRERKREGEIEHERKRAVKMSFPILETNRRSFAYVHCYRGWFVIRLEPTSWRGSPTSWRVSAPLIYWSVKELMFYLPDTKQSLQFHWTNSNLRRLLTDACVMIMC